MTLKTLVLATAVALGLAATVVPAHEEKSAATQSPSDQIHHAMMDGMHKAMDMKMSGNVDRDFAAMMIDHHRQALAMAKIEIAHGGSAELKAMAQKMIDTQRKEIVELVRFAR